MRKLNYLSDLCVGADLLDKLNYFLSRAFSSSNGRDVVMIAMHIPFEEEFIKNRFYGCSETTLQAI